MTKTSTSHRWSVPVAVQDVPVEGLRHDLVADAPTRAAIAKIADVQAITRLEASFDTMPYRDNGLHVIGQVVATADQTCVVTLEPIESEIVEPVDLLFVPAKPGSTTAVDGSEAAGDEQPETLDDRGIDLAAVAIEFLLLGIDPYPRKAGATFTPPAVEEGARNPFAALAALKKGVGDG